MKRLAAVIIAGLIAASGVLGMAACSGGSGSSDTVQYIVYTGGGSLDGAVRIKNKVDEYVYEKLGFHVELNYLPYTEYSAKLGLKLNTNEYFDMCYIGSLLTGNPYSLRASEGYFKDITDDLPKYAPDIYNSLSADVWQAAKVNGKIYGVVNEQIFARSTGVAIDKEVVKALRDGGYDLSQKNIDENGVTYIEVINKAMEYIKGNPEISPNGKVPQSTLILGNAYDDIFMQNYSFDSLGTSSAYPGVIRARAKENVSAVINQYETEEFGEFAAFCMSMHEKGYIPDGKTVDITENQRVRLTGTYQPGCESDLYTQIGREFELFRFGTPMLTTNNVTSSVTAISVNSKNTDKCLKLLNLLYTDKTLYNLLAMGEERAEYNWTKGEMENAEGVMEEYDYIEYIPGNGYSIYSDWAFPTMFNAYRKIYQPADMAEQIRKINREAFVSVGNGFAFVPSKSVAKYQSDCGREIDIAIKQLLNGTFRSGITAEEFVNGLNEKLKTNGLDKILAEKQAKFDEFLAEK